MELLGERHELILELAPDQGVEGGERLVHEEHVRIGGEGPRESDTLLHAAGELTGEAVLEAVQTHEGQGVLRDVPAAPLGLAADFEGIGDVVAHRTVRQQGHVLEDHADLLRPHGPQLGLGEVHDVLSEELDDPCGRFDQAVEVTHEGGLAAAGEPHDAEDLAPADVERYVGDADHRPEAFQNLALGEPLRLHGRHGLPGPFAEDLPDPLQLDDDIVQGVGSGLPRSAGRSGPLAGAPLRPSPAGSRTDQGRMGQGASPGRLAPRIRSPSRSEERYFSHSSTCAAFSSAHRRAYSAGSVFFTVSS